MSVPVFATQHPLRRDDYVPTRHVIAHDVGEYMSFRAGVILGRLLSVTMEIGWLVDCLVRQTMLPLLSERGITIPTGGWVSCDFQESPDLWFFDGWYGALRAADGTFRFLCNRDGQAPEHLVDQSGERFPNLNDRSCIREALAELEDK